MLGKGCYQYHLVWKKTLKILEKFGEVGHKAVNRFWEEKNFSSAKNVSNHFAGVEIWIPKPDDFMQLFWLAIAIAIAIICNYLQVCPYVLKLNTIHVCQKIGQIRHEILFWIDFWISARIKLNVQKDIMDPIWVFIFLARS